MKTLAAIGSCLLALSLVTTPLVARELFVVTLIHAQNEDIEDSLGESHPLRNCLIRLFGYTKFSVLGTASSPLPEKGTLHLQPARSFAMSFQPMPGNSTRFHYELHHEDEKILEGCYIPKPGTPLIIRGPHYSKGNLILVVDRDSSKP